MSFLVGISKWMAVICEREENEGTSVIFMTMAPPTCLKLSDFQEF